MGVLEFDIKLLLRRRGELAAQHTSIIILNNWQGTCSATKYGYFYSVSSRTHKKKEFSNFYGFFSDSVAIKYTRNYLDFIALQHLLWGSDLTKDPIFLLYLIFNLCWVLCCVQKAATLSPYLIIHKYYTSKATLMKVWCSYTVKRLKFISPGPVTWHGSAWHHIL